MPIDYKDQIISKIDSLSDQLWDTSLEIFNNPETAFKEHRASQLLVNLLEGSGFSCESNLTGLETAFRASYGTDIKSTIAILAEYDALVGLGHACGHNLIAAAAVGAGIALAALEPKPPGKIQVIGTPGEEGGGGKILLANAGVFNTVDAAMMFHPADKNMVLRKSLSSSRVKIEFIGKASHAAAAPEDGINALDAMILTFNSINALRQTFLLKDRVAGVILEGGEAANIIPAHTIADFSIRSLTSRRRDELIQKVIACAQSSAQAVGCRLEYKITPGYKEIIPNRIMASLFTANLESLGRTVVVPEITERMGSTDMGNVSHIVPSIHPYLSIAPENTAGHTEEFKSFCCSDAGKLALLDAAKAMAMTAADMFFNPEYISQAKLELSSVRNS